MAQGTSQLNEYLCNLPLQVTPTSSEWKQLCSPTGLAGQSRRDDSFPAQLSWSRTISPLSFSPNAEQHCTVASKQGNIEYAHVTVFPMVHPHCITIFGGQLPAPKNPSCLQTTLASLTSKSSSQTVPQVLLLQISTRP